MGFYRRKPQIVEAFQYDGTAKSATIIIDWVLSHGGTATFHCDTPESCTADFHVIRLRTGLGIVSVRRTYWVAKRGTGFTIINDDLFSRTYDEVTFPDEAIQVTLTGSSMIDYFQQRGYPREEDD